MYWENCHTYSPVGKLTTSGGVEDDKANNVEDEEEAPVDVFIILSIMEVARFFLRHSGRSTQWPSKNLVDCL